MNVEPDVLATADRSLPGEWAVQGERGLCLALLEDALNVALGKTPATPRERDEALEWIRSESENPFGFARVCSELGLDPLEIRRKVERQLAARPEPATVADRQAPLPE